MNRRFIYRVCFWLYAALIAGLAVWMASCLVLVPENSVIGFWVICGVPQLLSFYLYAMLLFTGFEIWASLGAVVLKAVCVLVLKDRGAAAAGQMSRLRPLTAGILAAHVLMFLDAIVCASVPVLRVAGMMSEPNGAVVLIGAVSFGLLFVGGIVWCGFCAIMAAASVPMVRFVLKWSLTAWAGAFDAREG